MEFSPVPSSPEVGIKKVRWIGDILSLWTDIPWVPVVQASLRDLGIPSGQENQQVQESLSPPIKNQHRIRNTEEHCLAINIPTTIAFFSLQLNEYIWHIFFPLGSTKLVLSSKYNSKWKATCFYYLLVSLKVYAFGVVGTTFPQTVALHRAEFQRVHQEVGRESPGRKLKLVQCACLGMEREWG